nr:MAG TPA: hypothetical protein [Caudoviricetes sp.]
MLVVYIRLRILSIVFYAFAYIFVYFLFIM